MTHELQAKANELIHALGALSVAQESRVGSDDISELTQRAVDLKEELLAAYSDTSRAY
ncbi:MAG: hypothetical protein O3B04_05720 [Chloroflexi bacterium]|nr:hypothetical protein [Chloroflexota bacterium]MDA1297485.1 hypothetical protein [Chloroflexota bacterium]